MLKIIRQRSGGSRLNSLYRFSNVVYFLVGFNYKNVVFGNFLVLIPLKKYQDKVSRLFPILDKNACFYFLNEEFFNDVNLILSLRIAW